MRRVSTYFKSSFRDPCCSDTGTTGDAPLLWRAKSDTVVCLKDGVNNTGYARVGELEQYNGVTGDATGVTKLNTISDANYMPDYITNQCAVPLSGDLVIYNNFDCPLKYNFRDTSHSVVDKIGIVPVGGVVQVSALAVYNRLTLLVLKPDVMPADHVQLTVDINGFIYNYTYSDAIVFDGYDFPITVKAKRNFDADIIYT